MPEAGDGHCSFARMLDKAKFATLRGGRRVWAVAAIHGDAGRLQRLHAELGKRLCPGDRLIYLGNYLGYGRDICATVDNLLLFRREILARRGFHACDIAFLRGAQEEMWGKLLQIHLAFNPVDVIEWMLERGVGATMLAYGADADRVRARARIGAVELVRWARELRAAMRSHPGHDALMNALRRAAFTDNGALLFVHAGIDAGRPLAAQSDTLWWGGSSFDAMSKPYSGFKRVVRGFDRAGKGFRTTPFTATLDGGCGFGGSLNAACFDADGQFLDLVEG